MGSDKTKPGHNDDYATVKDLATVLEILTFFLTVVLEERSQDHQRQTFSSCQDHKCALRFSRQPLGTKFGIMNMHAKFPGVL